MPVQWKLLSPFLKDMAGHEAEYVKRLVQAILASGDSAEVFLPRGDGAVIAPSAERLLVPPNMSPPTPGMLRRMVRKPVRLVRKFQAQAVYRHLFRTGTPSTLWLLHTANFDEIEIVLRAFARAVQGETSRGVLKIVLRADHNDDPLRKVQFRRVLSLCGAGVSLYADTCELAEELSKFAPVPVDVVPVPGVGLPATEPTVRPWRFGYFGLRRRSKGFDRLASLVPALSDVGEGGLSLQVMVHGSAEVDTVEDHAESEDRLRAAGAHICSEHLSTEAYLAALLATEIILLPYDSQAYRYGSSGVFVDAVKAGCSLIVPSGTWMAQEAVRNRLSRVFEARFDHPEQVAEVAVRALAQRSTAVPPSSWEQNWMQRNSPQGVFERLR